MSIKIKDLPNEERPRERLWRLGAGALRDAELIAILLRTGWAGGSALEVAELLLKRFQGLSALGCASLEEIQMVKGVGRDKAILLKSAFVLAQRMMAERPTEPPLLDNPDSIADLLRERNRAYEVEHFQVVQLNTRRRLIRVDEISQGTLDSLLVHSREVFRQAILANASAVVLVHNHPSGDPSPSEADLRVTRDLIRAGRILKIEVLDHIILGRRTSERLKDFISLREMGVFDG